MSRDLGLHRVLSPAGVLPQAAEKLDADPTRRDPSELHIAVETLNVDSASFRQLEEAEKGDVAGVAHRILEIVRARGKLQNPVTGSGGMLLGKVAWVGERVKAHFGVDVGDRVATLVSLTLTPLTIDAIVAVHAATHQVDVRGNAVIFASGMVARMPADLPERVALAAFDVAGAAPQVARMAKPRGSVLVLGAGGKSGLLASVAARGVVGEGGCVVGLEAHDEALAAARRVGACHALAKVDAADPVATCTAALGAASDAVRARGGFDLVVSCVNVAGAELGAILSTRQRGMIYFFSMATQFARAALGAEGVSADVDMLIGNGYAHGHAEATLALIRGHAGLRDELIRRFT